MKRMLALCLTALLLSFLLLPGAAFATETEETSEAVPAAEETTAATEESTEPTRPADSCGENLTWSYDGGVLTVSGSGAMDDYADGGAPWNEYRGSITTVVFTGGVTYVGANAFRDYDALTSIDFGSAMHTIGEKAFQSCEGLTEIHLPSTFRRFATQCFEGCTSLTKVWCAGSMPSFNFNCLWNYTSITVYCPTNSPWPAGVVEELETNFGGRLQVLCADGTDPYDFGDDETEATTAPTTEPATEPTAAPTTEATEPVTEATEAVTEETTEPTEVTEETTEATEATEETEPTVEETGETEPMDPETLAGKSWIGVVIIAGILTLLVVGALIFRASSRGGKYSA